RQTEVDRLQAFHATAAEMLMQIGDAARARAAYARAIDLSGDPRVREWLRKRVTPVDERGRASFDFDSSDRSDEEGKASSLRFRSRFFQMEEGSADRLST